MSSNFDFDTLEDRARGVQRLVNNNDDSWVQCEEVPTEANFLEMLNKSEREDFELPVNKIDQPWGSKREYLKTHFQLLREDALRPLKKAVTQVMQTPRMNETKTNSTIGIYDHVLINAFTFSTRGLGVRVTFSLNRIGKNVRWSQSKRLKSGSLVALIQKDDTTKCKLAVVAARPISGLEKNPPEIHLFFGHATEVEIDSCKEFIMVEERAGFFEAERHTLVALQEMATESFPLSEYLLDFQDTILPPVYVSEDPFKQIDCVLPAKSPGKTNILTNWPLHPEGSLDVSQFSALQRILTKRLAIIQGPPGTGKTHVSIKALEVIISNRLPGDPPIILTSHTNHALDQLLRHVAKFEESYIRLGAWSKDPAILQRTLFEVRKTRRGFCSGRTRAANREIKLLQKEMAQLLQPVQDGSGLLEPELLLKLGILNEKQCECLREHTKEWIDSAAESTVANPLKDWLGNKLVPARNKICYPQFFEFEELELEQEEIEEMEAENAAREDDSEMLQGETIEIADTWTGGHATGKKLTEDDLRNLLKTENLWKIKPNLRGAVYKHIQDVVKNTILRVFRLKAIAYAKAVQERKLSVWKEDHSIIKAQNVIGVTITGFSKYRALLKSIRPKIVLVEEAAEALEAPVVATCIESLQHLILVGDHKQLRPHCHARELEGAPFHLSISLFERLLNNRMEFTILRYQRRMIPDISKLLYPIYGDQIQDHECVRDKSIRPRVSGMGKTSVYFFTHDHPESRDSNMSSYNVNEADMIIAFVQYLVLNGTNPEEISILTFYNGQRKIILNRLSKLKPRVTSNNLHVGTVDSYQGEENSIVILSLVRSNQKSEIGFLNVANRVTVAMSRAQRGLYVFGNFEFLASENELWATHVTTMYRGLPHEKKANRCIGYYLPLRCVNHNRKTWIQDYDDWFDHSGGCDIACKKMMNCGHACPKLCHPPINACECNRACSMLAMCGHKCNGLCGEPCYCRRCDQSTKNSHGPAIAPQTLVYLSHQSQESKCLEESVSRTNSRFQALHLERNTSISSVNNTDQDDLEYLDWQNSSMLFGGPWTNLSSEMIENTHVELSKISLDGHRSFWTTHHSRFSESPSAANSKHEAQSLLDDP